MCQILTKMSAEENVTVFLFFKIGQSTTGVRVWLVPCYLQLSKTLLKARKKDNLFHCNKRKLNNF